MRYPSNMSNDDVSVVLCTAPEEDAPRLARAVVEARLVACVNLLPAVRSFYWWEGKVEDDAEALLVLKTRSANVEALTRFLVDTHPYDVPEVIALPVTAGSRPYLDWVLAEASGSTASE